MAPSMDLAGPVAPGVTRCAIPPERLPAGGPATANPNNEIWVPNPDLSKVDEIGFADLMPGSGHGTGGYIQLGKIEVYANTIPRATATSSR